MSDGPRPPSPGVFSALGLLFSDTRARARADASCARRRDHRGGARDGVRRARARAERAASPGTPARTVDASRYADVRYAGQAYELPVRVAAGAIDVDRARGRLRRRARAHLRPRLGRRPGRRRLGPRARAVSSARRTQIATTRLRDDRGAAAPRRARHAYFGPARGDRDAGLQPGGAARPASGAGRSSSTSTTRRCVVPPGLPARLDRLRQHRGRAVP